MQRKEEFIKQALSEFVGKHSVDAPLSLIDDIALQYIVSILEELGGSNSFEDIFDVDEFTEMMEAYVPGFQNFNSVEVSEWMFELANQLAKETDTVPEDSIFNSLFSPPHSISISLPDSIQARGGHPERSDSSNRNRTVSDSEVKKNSDFVTDESLSTLREMFPSTSQSELRHCLGMSGGDLEQAVMLLLNRQEDDFENGCSSKIKVPDTLEDPQLKRSIVAKYSYVDTDDDKKQHKPIAPKSEPKKLVRYLDGKVVSMKGERYTEIKKSEDEDMKNTYISLKPAKQYRFH